MSSYLDNLNDAQRQAASHVDGPLLVLAGAGSGKTRVITRRVAHLIDQGVAPWNILALTFTNKAAGEMLERIESMNLPRGVTAATFHSLCARLLREFAPEANLTSNYSIYDRDDQIRLVKQAMGELDLPTDKMPPSRVHAAISNAKNDLVLPGRFAEQAEGFYDQRVAKVYFQYQQLLKENNALDFDDLLLKMARLLETNQQIRQLLGQRYRYILIDEYQDTNRSQYLIARAIGDQHRNICATGDPDQSIYAWRGADIRNILQFEQDYPDATVVRLEENYRSSQPILTAASALIDHNKNRKSKKLWTSRSGGADVILLTCIDEHDEANRMVAHARSLQQQGYDLSDMAVFYRVNSLSRTLEESLRKAALPYRIARGTEFYSRKEVKDVLAYLKALVNPADDISCLRIINTPPRGIGGTTVKRLVNQADAAGLSVVEACRRAGQFELGRSGAKVAAFGEMMSSLADDLDRPVRDIVEDVVRRSGLEDALRADNDENRRPYENVGELISTAADFDADTEGGTLADFLHQVALVSDADRFEGDGGAITLMTLHAAKGLEFPVVFMVGLEQGLLPFSRGNDPWGEDDADLEEERRLAFVGMTRAKDRLIMSSARRRRVRGQMMSQQASIFLDEIGTDGVDHDDLAALEEPSARPQHSRGGFYEPARQREVIEDAFDGLEMPLPPEYEYLTPGCPVNHSTYGMGQVVKISSHRWPETRVTVQFQTVGVKRLMLRQANLEVLEG